MYFNFSNLLEENGIVTYENEQFEPQFFGKQFPRSPEGSVRVYKMRN
jgi:hypothetical protein